MQCFLYLYLTVLIIKHVLSAWSYTPGQAKNWDNARKDCQSQGGDLASFSTAADFAAAKSFVLSINPSPTKDLWSGLRLDTTLGTSAPYKYIWPDGTTATYFDWDSAVGEPDGQSVDHCVRLHVGSWKWRTRHCSSSYDYICDGVPPAVTTTPSPPPATTTTKPTTTTELTTTGDGIPEVTGSLDDYWAWEDAMAETGYIGLVFGFGFTFVAIVGICAVWYMCCIRKRRLEQAEEKKREIEKFNKEQTKKLTLPVFSVEQKTQYIPQTQDVLFS